MKKTEIDNEDKGERIAKRMARAGVCSRRDAERMIEAGRVSLNGKILETPAVKVFENDKILVDGKGISKKEEPRLWIFHKPKGLVTSHRDEKGRDTIFDYLPKDMPRVISVGRLDLTSEGLLLLTNDGELSRFMELPKTGWVRRYRVRAYGRVSQEKLDTLKNGVKIKGVSYGGIEASIDKTQGSNTWIKVALKEGKNREIRRVFEHLGLDVNRLIRTSYGPFNLANLPAGAVKEVGKKEFNQAFEGMQF